MAQNKSFNANNVKSNESMEWNLNQMPKCQLPPHDEFSPVEHYVTVAITARVESANEPKSISFSKQQVDPYNSNGLDQKGIHSSTDVSEGNTKSLASSSSYLSGYTSILDCIRKRNDPALLWKILLALRGHPLSIIASNPSVYDQLIHLIMKLDVFKPPKSVSVSNDNNNLNLMTVSMGNDESKTYFTDYLLADAYLHFLVGLVSANSIFLIPCVESIWKNITKDLKSPHEKTSRLHSALASILRLVPKAHTELFPVLSQNIPFRRADVKQHGWYAKQSFIVLQYAPDLHEEILRLLINKCLEIDVEIKIDHKGKVSLDENNIQDEIFDFDMDEDDLGRMKEKKHKENVEVDEMAERLDTLMVILMKHIRSYSIISNQNIAKLFGIMLRIFNSNILTTHRSKYVQFLMLYICGLDDQMKKSKVDTKELCYEENRIYREFAAHLINNFISPSYPSIARQSSVCYLASFIARASYINACTVCESVAALLRWCDTYVNSHDYTAIDGFQRDDDNVDHEVWKQKIQAHADFYNICQAACYIMCFRGTEAFQFYEKIANQNHNPSDMDSEDYNVDLQSVDIGSHRWERIYNNSKLQPLKYCLESVRRESLRLSQMFHFLPKSLVDYHLKEDEKTAKIMEEKQFQIKTPSRTNLKRSSISTPATKERRRQKDLQLENRKKEAGGVGGLGKGVNPLDSFFPFDPCLLRESHGLIEPYYIEWDGSIKAEKEMEIKHKDSSDKDIDDNSNFSCSSDDDDSSYLSDHSDVHDISPMSLTSTSSHLEIDEKLNSIESDYTDNELNTKIAKKWLDGLDPVKRQRAQSIGTGSW